MYCANCGKSIGINSQLCQSCETKKTSNHVNTSQTSDGVCGVCQACRTRAPVRYNEFYANIGMFVVRRQMSVKGKMCKKCINKYFLQYTLINLFLGWWGLISFFATCFFMINNIVRYIWSIQLKKIS